jgi:uncharacterized UBP type Zn finger protein
MKCEHVEQIRDVKPKTRGCEECMKTGGKWVALRMCMTCGHVGCCDSSPGMHAREHFNKTKHPIIKSIEPGQDWMWCYVDKAYVEK